MGKRVDGNMQLAAVLMNEVNGFLKLFLRKVKASKMAGVGVIFQPDIDRIGPILDGRLKRRRFPAGQSSSINYPDVVDSKIVNELGF